MLKNPGNRTLTEIKNGNEKVLTKVYRKVFRHMQKYGLLIGANQTEIEEAVQDAFEVFYRQILSDELVLSCTVETYVISIAKRTFLVNERNRQKNTGDTIEEPENIIDKQDNETKIEELQHQLYLNEFNKLGDDCQKVLSETLKGSSLTEITKYMGYSSVQFTKTKRARCRKYLITKIKENPLYEKLRNTPENFEISFRRNEFTREDPF